MKIAKVGSVTITADSIQIDGFLFDAEESDPKYIPVGSQGAKVAAEWALGRLQAAIEASILETAKNMTKTFLQATKENN